MYNLLNVPKVGNSDIYLKLNLLTINGQFVLQNTVVSEFESSKTLFEYELDQQGYFYSFYDQGESVKIGEPFAIISKEQLSNSIFLDIKDKFLLNEEGSTTIEKKSNGKTITKGAKKLIEEHSLNIDDFSENFINERIVNEEINKKAIQHQTEGFRFEKSDVLIYGLGGHAGMCIDIITSSSQLNLRGYIDEQETKNNRYGLKYFGNLSNLDNLIIRGLNNVVIGTAFFENITKRQNLFYKVSLKVNIPTIVHSSAIIEKSANIGEGCQIMAGSIIGSNVRIGNNCIINSGSIVSHDSDIGHSTHVTPGACIAGGVTVGERVLIGMCSTIFLGLVIGNDVVIKNNQSVLENI